MPEVPPKGDTSFAKTANILKRPPEIPAAECEDMHDMLCPKCGYTYADTLPSCPRCGHSRGTHTLRTPLLLCCICILMTAVVLLFLCDGHFAPFWICFSVAGWIFWSGKTSQRRRKSGLRLCSTALKVLQIFLLILAALAALLAVLIFAVGCFTGDTWLAYLAGVATEYGAKMLPAAVLGRFLGTAVSYGGMVAVGSVAIALAAVSAAAFLTARLLIPIRRYVYHLLYSASTENPVPRRTFHADASLTIFGAIYGLYGIHCLSQDNSLGFLASVCAAGALLLLAWTVRKVG